VAIDVVVHRPVDRVRCVADPIVFAFAMQLIAHATWKTFSLPDPVLPVVIELACSGFALSRIAAIGRLARQYRVTCDVDIRREPSIPAVGASAWTGASATMSMSPAARQVCGTLHRPHHRLERRTRPRRRRGGPSMAIHLTIAGSGPVILPDVGR
jgi:hypothetical protein